MYCSSCGSALTPNLLYCNKCGARVGADDTTIRRMELAPEFLIAAMVSLFVLGLGVIIGLMATMRRVVGLEPGVVLGITFVCFSLLVLMEGIFIYFLFRGRSSRERKSSELLKEHTTKELESGSPLGLPPQPASVTEHTTRAFDPVYIERKQ